MVSEKGGKAGADPISVTPDAFGEMMSRDIARYAPVVKASGAKVD